MPRRRISREEFERMLIERGIKPTYARWTLWLNASKEFVDLYNAVISQISDVLKHPKVRSEEELRPLYERQIPLIRRERELRRLLETRWRILNWVVLNPLDIARVDRRTWRILDEIYIPDYDTVFTEMIDYIRERLREKDELIARLLERFYRNMVVRNYSATVELPYPFLAEVRATYISRGPVDYITTDTGRRIRLIDALGITVQNMVSFFLPSIRAAEKKGKVSYTNESIEIDVPELGEIVRTLGTEINRPVSRREIAGFPLEYCIKYVRIVNEQTLRSRRFYEYNNNQIESALAEKCIIDSKGFVWVRR